MMFSGKYVFIKIDLINTNMFWKTSYLKYLPIRLFMDFKRNPTPLMDNYMEIKSIEKFISDMSPILNQR
jgi:hypothetical protein